jgi:hypothetical protein
MPFLTKIYQPCTLTKNTVCYSCKVEEYCNGTVRQYCTFPCFAGTYEAVKCNNTTNRVCVACSDGWYSAANATQFMQCISPCVQWQKQLAECTFTQGRQCLNCSSNEYCNGLVSSPCTLPCTAGFYQSVPCTQTSDRLCLPCSPGSYSLPGTTFCTT